MPTMNKVDLLDCAAGHHDFSDDAAACHVCGHTEDAAGMPHPAGLWTVILLKPDFMRGDLATEYDWTCLFHVEATYPEEAFGKAQDMAIAGNFSPEDYDKPEPEAFAVLAVFPGHLEDHFIP